MKHFVKTRLFGIPPARWMYASVFGSFVDAGHLQRDVRLDRRREVGRALPPVRPGAVVAAAGEDVVREAAVGLRVAQAEDVQPEEVLRDHRRVRLELADPPAAGVLELEQAVGRPVDGLVEAGELLDGAHCRVTASAAATPLRTAASIVAGQSEAVHAPARYTCSRDVCIGHRRLRVPGRAAKVARGSRLTRDQRSSASPSRSRSASAIVSTRPLPRISSSSGTPLETTVRYWPPPGGSWPVSAPRSKTQCAGESSSAASRWRSSGRSKSRWTLTIGESSRAGGAVASRRAASVSDTADDHRVRIELVERFDARLEPHVAAGGAEGTPGRVAVHLPERLGRQQQVARAAAAEERRLDGEDPVVGAGLLGGQVERRPDEDVPEAVDLRLAMSETA